MTTVCTFCGSNERIEQHHVAGRNHIPWFTLPLCRKHHALITQALQQAGIDMRYTDDNLERLRRALSATNIFQWWLLISLQEELLK